MRLFFPDSKLVRVLSRLADMMLINLCFLLTCIPIFTVGASITALYTVSFRFDTPREGRNVKDYFIAFKKNFKQSTVFWFLLVFCGAAVFFDMSLAISMRGTGSVLSVLCIVLLVIWQLVETLSFPLISRYENTLKQTLKNALILGIAYFPRCLLMSAINLLPFYLLFKNLYIFLYTGFIWLALYFSAAAYVNTLIMKKMLRSFENREG